MCFNQENHMKLTREQITMLAKQERMMDSGQQPYVILSGERMAVDTDTLDKFRL